MSGLIIGLHPAKEVWRYFVTMSLIGWAAVGTSLESALHVNAMKPHLWEVLIDTDNGFVLLGNKP